MDLMVTATGFGRYGDFMIRGKLFPILRTICFLLSPISDGEGVLVCRGFKILNKFRKPTQKKSAFSKSAKVKKLRNPWFAFLGNFLKLLRQKTFFRISARSRRLNILSQNQASLTTYRRNEMSRCKHRPNRRELIII